MYDDQTQTVAMYRDRHTALSLVTQVSFNGDTLVLARNRSVVQRVHVRAD